jgi:flagellar protein FlgJ
MPSPLNAASTVPSAESVRPALNKPAVDNPNRTREIEKTCQDFESLFINYMLQQMRQTIPQNGLFDGGRAEQLYTSMMDGELAKSISQQRGLGLAPMMFRQLVSQVEDGKDQK